MKKVRGSLVLTFLASLLLLGLRGSPSSPPFVGALDASCGAAGSCVAEYRPAVKKRGLGRVLDWTLAQIENVFDAAVVSDLITTFLAKCDRALALLLHSFRDMTLSYEELREREAARAVDFDREFKELAKLRNKIDRKCLHSVRPAERSLCVERGVEIHARIADLRRRRSQSAEAVARYEEWAEWCAGYGNWLC